MVFVVLRNGRVIQYNDGGQVAVENGSYTINKHNKHGGWLIARVPVEIVERVEFGRPCRVMTRKAYEKTVAC